MIMRRNGQKASISMFVNLGDQELLGSMEEVIITIYLKVKQSGKFNLKPEDGIIVSNGRKSLKFEI